MAIKTTGVRSLDIKKITADLNQPDIKVVFYFYSVDMEQKQIQREIKQAFPGAACLGATMIGGWAPDEPIEHGSPAIVGMSLGSDEVETVVTSFREGVKTDATRTAREVLGDLKRQMPPRDMSPDTHLGIVLVDGLAMAELVMKELSLDRDINIPFVGGAAADELSFSRTCVSLDDRLSSDGLLAAILKMKIPFFYDHYNHFIPSNQNFVATRSEPDRRIVWELDGKTAASYYADAIGLKDVTDLDTNVFTAHPLGVIIGDTIYARSPFAVVDGKGLQFYCSIEAGTKVNLLQSGDIIENSRNALDNARQYLPEIQGALLFNCVLRYLEMRKARKMATFSKVFGQLQCIGFNTFGEELFTHHNQTLTAVFFGSRHA